MAEVAPGKQCSWCGAGDPEATSHDICGDCADQLLAEDARDRAVSVEQHPQGGWTHGVPSGGATRIFSGWYPSRRAAQEALSCR